MNVEDHVYIVVDDVPLNIEIHAWEERGDENTIQELGDAIKEVRSLLEERDESDPYRHADEAERLFEEMDESDDLENLEEEMNVVSEAEELIEDMEEVDEP